MTTPTDLTLPTPKPVPAPRVDDRVVLPLAYTREAARMLCMHACRGGVHLKPCLVPLLADRDKQMAEQPPVGQVSPDCAIGGVKCQACTGCIHECHRPHGGEFGNRVTRPPLVR